MKIVIAPDKFKGSRSAWDVAGDINWGLKRVLPAAQIDLIPMADGGEGTVDALTAAMGGQKKTVSVTGPLGRQVKAEFGVFLDEKKGKTGVIEMSSASGIQLVAGANRPLEATTYGTGELIKAALDIGCRRLVLGIGGSATTDGGVGMAEALGARFLDADGMPLARGGGALAGLRQIDLNKIDRRLEDVEILVACDVDNVLYGKKGAAFVYAPQKGATPAQVKELDTGLKQLAWAIANDLNIDVADIPAAGAAGGLGAGLVAFCAAKLHSGIELISEAVRLSARLKGADLAITGEGQIDRQTIRGKVPLGVARLAKALGVPTVAIVGTIGPGAEEIYEHEIKTIESICTRPMTYEEAFEDVSALIQGAAERLIRSIQVGRLLRDD